MSKFANGLKAEARLQARFVVMILRKNRDPGPLKLKKGDLLGDTGGRGERMQSKLVMVLVLIFVGGLAEMAPPARTTTAPVN